MTQLLCRNRAADYDRWRAVFDAHSRAHQDSGLELVNLWRSVDDPNDVHFLFQVTNVQQAKAFLEAPAASAAGVEAGVIEGEFHFVENAVDR